MQHNPKDLHVCIDIYDEVGVAGGASGVSGGLLHPYSPKGNSAFLFLHYSLQIFPELISDGLIIKSLLPVKPLWRGVECWKESLKLLSIAEAAVESKDANTGSQQLAQSFNRFIVRRRLSLFVYY